jgi:phospholipase/carboxylesterase
MPRFFRRLAEGVFDQDDLRTRTDELAQFVTDAAVIAAGYSNGANIAASLPIQTSPRALGSTAFPPDGPLLPEPNTGAERFAGVHGGPES